MRYTGWLLNREALTHSTAAVKIAPCGVYVVSVPYLISLLNPCCILVLLTLLLLQFDLRGKDAVQLFKCGAVDHFSGENVELFAIAIDPRKPCSFAVAGSDEYARIYDARKICLDGNSRSGRPTEHFCPPHLIGKDKDGITGLAFSQTSELLASYSYDNIYLFSTEHGLHFNDIEVGERLLMDETEGACNINTAPLPFCRDKLPIPKTFKGHRNMHTIKGVNFLGPNCDYVTSGSDCGHIFIWRKKDGELIRVVKGDKGVVNCVEQHPFGLVVASSGIENDIKIWEPGECENPSISHIEEVCSRRPPAITIFLLALKRMSSFASYIWS
jgi:DDB1- and CUL4-associated factor 8